MGPFGESIDKYEVYELLGKGGFGQVYRARVRETGMEVAIKMIDKKLMTAARMVNRVKQEVSIHSRLKHPAVLELYTCFEDDFQVYLVLELCHNGELQSYMKTKRSTFSELEARHILKQVVEGLIYLHSHKIIHRDITLANLLLTKDMKVKIGDFGLATQLNSADEKHMTMCGTPNYISPEIAVRASHGLETDVWGLGIILYTVLVGKPPFDTENREMIITLIAMREIDFPDHLSADCVDLMKCLLKKNPKDRISLAKILEHPFMVRQVHSYNGSFPSSGYGSSNSGMAYSVPSTLPRRSCSDRIIDSTVRQPLPLLPSQSSVSNGYSAQKQSGFTSSNCYSSASAPGHNGYPVPMKSAVNDRRNVELSQNSLLPPSGFFSHPPEILSYDAPGSRYLSGSNQTSMTLRETNCSHVWNQCGGQCSHIDTCSCIHSRQPSATGCSSSCGRSNVNYSSCATSNHPKEHVSALACNLPTSGQRQVSSESGTGVQKKVQVEPLTTSRLKPIRQKTKQVILNILDTGEVCLEFLKVKNKCEKVFEVVRISSDGQRIVVYYPNKGKGAVPQEHPPPLPEGGADGIFWHENLPEKYVKKYSYASRFVDLVRAQTPKVIYYSHKAKCMLMENSPDPDFQVNFYDGPKFNKAGSQVIVTDEEGHSSTHFIASDGAGLPPAMKILWDHFKLCLEECTTRERLLSEISSSTGLSMFPNRIGERPNALRKSSQTPGSAKSSPGMSVCRPQIERYAESAVSAPGGVRQGKVMKQVQIPGIGNAMQMSNGVVCIQYSDNSKLFVEPSSSKISFQDPSGYSQHYQQNDLLPKDAREKLTHVHRIFEALKHA